MGWLSGKENRRALIMRPLSIEDYVDNYLRVYDNLPQLEKTI
jgi:hypothetical protein